VVLLMALALGVQWGWLYDYNPQQWLLCRSVRIRIVLSYFYLKQAAPALPFF
jgi:hypothetical protein